jgi:hypothetical protein
VSAGKPQERRTARYSTVEIATGVGTLMIGVPSMTFATPTTEKTWDEKQPSKVELSEDCQHGLLMAYLDT